MDIYYAVVDLMRLFALGAGSFVIFAGIARGVMIALWAGDRARVARQIGEHAALGLDFFVGATLLNLAINLTLMTAAAAALTIVVRKLVTLSLGLTWRGGRSPPTGP